MNKEEVAMGDALEVLIRVMKVQISPVREKEDQGRVLKGVLNSREGPSCK